MRDVVFRYLFGESLRTWLAVVGVLLFLTLGMGLSRFIGDAAAGNIPVNTVLGLAFFSALENLQIVLPVSILLAILLVVGRLCRDNELTALLAGGVSLGTVYRPFFALALAVAVFSGVLSIIVAPRAELAMDRLGAHSAASMIESLAPGRFTTVMDGKVAFYAQGRDPDGNLSHVFLRVTRKGDHGQPTRIVITARRAREQVDPATRRVTLILDDGWRYDGVPGKADYRVIRFGTYGMQVHPPLARAQDKVDTQRIGCLLASDDPGAEAEWQKRFSVPLSILILTLLALPLGRAPPRSGRYGRVIVGILLYVIYVNAIHLASVALENDTVPAVVGVWWVHGLVLALAVLLVLRDGGLLVRRRRQSAQ